MNVDEELEKIAASIDQLQLELTKRIPSVNNPTVQQSLDHAKAQLSEGRAQFVSAYKHAVAGADEKLARAQKTSKEVLAKAAAAEKELKVPPPPKVPPKPTKPEFVVDPSLGQKMRRELLERYATDHHAAESQAWEDSREVWDDWADWSQN